MTSANTSGFSALLWDVDGTLIDTTDLIVASLNYVYNRHFHRTLPESECRALIGIPLAKQIRVFGDLEPLGLTEATVMGDFIAYYEQHRDQERILEQVTAILINGKKRGLPTALVTSKNREELANTLPRLGIAEYIDLAITADDVAHPKPAPEGLLRALAHFQIPAEAHHTAAYIGDTLHDMQAAHAAGVTAIGVAWGAAGLTRLATATPHHLCHTAKELEKLLYSN